MTIDADEPIPHPDDFIEVHATLKFRAKLNPDAETSAPVLLDVGVRLSASDAVHFLERVVHATNERRLYGFMVQHMAETDASDWIKGSAEDFGSSRLDD